MPMTTCEPPTDDAEPVVVEADTTADAVAAVADRLGEGATVLSAERVLRGGIRGFFGAQRIRLTAVAPGPTDVPAADGVSGSPPGPSGDGPSPAAAAPDDEVAGTAEAPTGLAAALHRLAADQGDREADFAVALRRHLDLGEDAGGGPTPPAATGPADRAVARPTAATGRAARHPDAPRWSAGVRWLLPGVVADRVVAQHPAGDAEWLLALADAVAPLCGPRPPGPEVLVGPRAAALAEALDVPVWDDLTAPAPAGDIVAAPVRDTAAAVEAVAAARGGRAVHLVLSGRGLVTHLPALGPQAVSWSGDDALCEALELCSREGLVLGYGRDGQARAHPAYRATPMDVAVGVRRMMPR